jgi:glycosyltransferase involved in cell wall biosynthesis
MAQQQTEQLSFDSLWSPAKGSLRGAKILFLVDEISAITDGGTERQILQMIEICNQCGMSPQICVFRGTRWLTADVSGCPVTRFQIGKFTSWRGLRSLVQLMRWICAQKVDILHTFFPEANLIGPCIGRLAGIPVVLGTRRNLNHACENGRASLLLRLQSLVNPLANQIIANSQAVLDRIVESERVSRKRICVVYNGIDLAHMRPALELRASMRKALGITDDQILVGNISGLRAVKGVQLFVDAAAKTYRHNPRLRFLLVGDGELKPQLEQSISALGLENIIRLNGPAEVVRPYLAAFDLAVLCSYAEGFSNSLLEYMACGVPVIATDVGGNREALGSCGLLIPPETTALASAIQTMSDSQTREKFAAAALLKVKQFDLAIARERMAQLYSYYLTQAGSGRRPVSQFIAHVLAMPLKAEKA